jgi:prepilin peptidase CpaA
MVFPGQPSRFNANFKKPTSLRDITMQIDQEFVYPAAASACAFIGSVFDVKSRRVPNFLTGPSILFGLLLHLSLGGWRAMGISALAGLICGLVFLIFYLAGGMGAGDVKLITAVGCICGLHNIASLLALTGIAGGVMAVGLALSRGRLKETLGNVVALVSHHRSEGLTPHPEINVLNVTTLRLPYALAISAGCVLTLCLQGVQR